MRPTPVVDPQRRSALLATKLAALVRDHLGTGGSVRPGVLTGGAALVRDGDAWVLADERPVRILGQAMAWARQQGVTGLHVLVDDPGVAGVLARRATAFIDPPEVLVVEGRALRPAQPAPFPPVAGPDPRVLGLAELIRAAGAEPVVEHGVLVGEVAGLEVCRAVVDPVSDEVRLEVGVGAHDREAFLLVHGSIPTDVALADVVGKVRAHRTAGAERHPLQTLAAERWLRHRALTDPSLLGLRSLAAAEPPLARQNVKDAVPCVAVGRDEAGAEVVVAFSVGIDLDLVPFAADARLALGLPTARLVLAVPTRDVHPVTRALAARLRVPAEVVALDLPS